MAFDQHFLRRDRNDIRSLSGVTLKSKEKCIRRIGGSAIRKPFASRLGPGIAFKFTVSRAKYTELE